MHAQERFSDHVVKNRMSWGGCYRPLAELHPVGYISPGIAFKTVRLDANNQTDLILQLLWNPCRDGFQRNGINIRVDTAFRMQNEVAQEVRFHACVLDRIVDCLDVGTIPPDESFGPSAIDKSASIGQHSMCDEVRMNGTYY